MGPVSRVGISAVLTRDFLPVLSLFTEIFWFVADRSPEIIIWKWKKMLMVKALEICIVSLAEN